MWYKEIADIENKLHPDCRVTPIRLYKHNFKSGKVTYCEFKCECGKVSYCRLSMLFRGAQKSCGCKKRNDTIKRNKKWENNSRSIGGRYRSMMSRCYDPKNSSYGWYGAIGVKVCDEWRNDYQKFVDWCNSNGISKEKELDKDMLGDGYLYSPKTCCFIDKKLNRSYQPKQKKGEQSQVATLSNELAFKIYKEDGSYGVLSKQYGVTAHTVRNIKKGVAWRSVTGHEKPIKNKTH